jgi:C-terminal processing protease CtpA/Prc
MTGLHIIRDEGKTLVHTVDPGSPAAKAGILAGDEIIKVNVKPAESFKLGQIRRMFASSPGNRVQLQTRRNGRDWDHELVLHLFSAPTEAKP